MAKAAASSHPTDKTRQPGVGRGGGPTAVGGYNFQAAVTARLRGDVEPSIRTAAARALERL